MLHDAEEAGVKDVRSVQMQTRMAAAFKAWHDFIENSNLSERYLTETKFLVGSKFFTRCSKCLMLLSRNSKTIFQQGGMNHHCTYLFSYMEKKLPDYGI